MAIGNVSDGKAGYRYAAVSQSASVTYSCYSSKNKTKTLTWYGGSCAKVAFKLYKYIFIENICWCWSLRICLTIPFCLQVC